MVALKRLNATLFVFLGTSCISFFQCQGGSLKRINLLLVVVLLRVIVIVFQEPSATFA
jgi:hypothetical protein